MKDKFKKNYKLILGMILGVIISASSVFAASVLTSDKVSYDNTKSGLSSTNIKDAIDEVNTKATAKLEEAKKECPDGKTCIAAPVSFSTDSWSTIANAVGLKSYPYKVGDTKTVDMGDLGTHTLRVANTSNCTNGETSQTACGFVVEFADIITTHNMNSTETNVGGWPASEMRTYVNGDIYNALPSELQNVIATTTVISSHGYDSTSGATNFTSSDKLYLLSAKEVWGGSDVIVKNDTAAAETRQLDYYENKGVSIARYYEASKNYNKSHNVWWLRVANSARPEYFFIVAFNGNLTQNYINDTGGVSPAFRIA